MTDMRAAVNAAVTNLAADHVDALAAAVEGAAVYTPALRATVPDAIPTAPFAERAAAVLDAWAAQPDLPGIAVAMALRSASWATEAAREAQRVEVVWTGPSSTAVPVRRTDAVLQQVIASAQRSLLVVSFAAYKVPTVIAALEAALARGVAVTLVLETTDAGVLTHSAAAAFESLRDRLTVLVWPLDQRARAESGGFANFHAKCAVADDHTALVTSANLTGAALAHNMELGLLVRGGEIPVRLAAHWHELEVEGVLQPA